MLMRRQHLQKRETFLTSEGNSALLPASACDQTIKLVEGSPLSLCYDAIDVYLEWLAHFPNCVFFTT